MGPGQLTPEGALARVVKYAAHIRISSHAYERMVERGVKRGDITRALKTGKSATYRAEDETWTVDGGEDLDGDPLVVVVALKPSGDVIVTVFGRDEGDQR